MNDPIYNRFLAAQIPLGRALVEANPGLLDLLVVAPNCFLARFHCKSLIRKPGEQVAEADRFEFGISLPPDYCRRVEPGVVTALTPHIFHPNVNGPCICLGRLAPATPLPDLLVQIFEVLVYLNYSPHDGLNPEASQWARNHPDRFPLERRPIRIPRQTTHADSP